MQLSDRNLSYQSIPEVKESDSNFALTATSIEKEPQRHLGIWSEKFFIVTCGLLVAIGYVVSIRLLVSFVNLVPELWNRVTTTVFQLEPSISVMPALMAIGVSGTLLFFSMKLVQMISRLFQAFWDSLGVD
jgi:hypothetical protein